MKVYIASLSDYNNGRLEGKWFDLSDYLSASDLMDEINDMLNDLTKKYKNVDGEVREEWAVHDYEGIPPTLASEYMGEADFEKLLEIRKVAEDRDIPVEVLVERAGDTGSDDYEALADSLVMVVDGSNEIDIVYELEDQMGGFGNDFWKDYMFIDDVTENVMYGEDLYRFKDDILYENPDMDDDEAERQAEELADEEAYRRRDLPSYLEEMGYGDEIPDFVTKDYNDAWKYALSYDYDVIHHDGDMYVFTNNYSVGGTILSGLVGAYIGYKIGRSKPQKKGFETEKKIGRKIKGAFSKKKFAGGGKLKEGYAIMQKGTLRTDAFKRVEVFPTIEKALFKMSHVPLFKSLSKEEKLKLIVPYSASKMAGGGNLDYKTYVITEYQYKDDNEVKYEFDSYEDANNRYWELVSDVKRYYKDTGDVETYLINLSGYVEGKDLEYIRHFNTDDYISDLEYANGGSIGFKGLSAKVAKRYAGKKVAPKYQGEYGKRYSKSEAKEVGDKVAGKVYWQQRGRKMATGGRIKDNDIQEGSEFTLQNGDVIVIQRIFSELGDGDWVRYTRNGQENENKISTLRMFINRVNGFSYSRGGNVNMGRSWHLDRARHNKRESYEKPLTNRKRKYEDGGQIGQEIVFDDNGEENTGVIKDITNLGDYVVKSDDGRTLLAQRDLDVISLGAMRSASTEAPRKRFGFFEDGGSVSGNQNKRFLDSLDISYKQRILRNIANHYGISIVEAEEEVTDSESENLYEYITDTSLRMKVYNDMKNRRYAQGGGVEKPKYKYYVEWLEDGMLQSEIYNEDEYEQAKELYYQIKYDLFDSQYKRPQIFISDYETGEVVFGDAFEYARGGGVDSITPALNQKVTKRALEIYSLNGGKTQSDFEESKNKAIIEFGYNPQQYHKVMREIGSEDEDDDYFAQGGGVSGIDDLIRG